MQRLMGTMMKNYQTKVEIIKQYPDLSRFLPAVVQSEIFSKILFFSGGRDDTKDLQL